MREKISISLDKDLVSRTDDLIDGMNIRNRSQAFDYVLRNFFTKKTVSKAIIMIAKSEKIAKANIVGIIDKLKEVGIQEIIIAGGKNNEKIFALIGTGDDIGIRLDYMHEENLLGTAGCLKGR